MYYHMATKYPDVVFVDVPVTNDNANHQTSRFLVLAKGEDAKHLR